MQLFWKQDPNYYAKGLSRHFLYENEHSPAILVMSVSSESELTLGTWFWLTSKYGVPGLYHEIDGREVKLMLEQPEIWWMERLL